MFESGELTLDTVCGVRAAPDKICLYPLNCKYHAVSIKKTVEGRTRPFDELLSEFNAAQLAQRKQEKSARSRGRAAGMPQRWWPHAAAANAAAAAAGYPMVTGG